MRHSSSAIQKFLNDQAQSSQTIASFCEDHDLKVPTFYSWKRKYDRLPVINQAGFCEILPRKDITQRSVLFSSGLRLIIDGLSIAEIAELVLEIDRAYA